MQSVEPLKITIAEDASALRVIGTSVLGRALGMADSFEPTGAVALTG